MKLDKKLKRNIFVSILFFLVLILNIYIAINHHGISDEHFYVAEAYRFAHGGKFIIDDWHIAQLMGFITSPLVWLYELVFKTSEGLVLFFRLCYILLHCITSYFIIRKFRDSSKYVELIALIYFLFVPFNIMNLSYNTMSIDFMMLSVCLFSKNQNLQCLISGIIFSLAVLCSPYLALLYGGVIGYSIYLLYKKRDKEIIYSIFYSFVGILFVFILFIIRVIPKDINLFLHNLSYVLNDPSHSGNVIDGILRVCYQSYTFLGIIGIIFGLVCICNFFIKSKKILSVCVLLGCLSLLYYVLISRQALNIGGYCIINLILTLLGMSAINLENRKDLKMFFGIYLIHALFIALTSNVGVRSFANVLINTSVISLICLVNVLDKKQLKTFIIFILIGLYSYFRFNYYYIESNDYSFSINSGVLKGLKSDQEFLDSYNLTLRDIKEIDTLEGDKVYIISDESWPMFSFNDKKVINYSYYQYLYSYDDCKKFLNDYLLLNNYDDFYVYECNNRFNLNVSDLDDDFKVSEVKKLSNGKLYWVELTDGN